MAVEVDKISGGKAEQITDERGLNLNVADGHLSVSIAERQKHDGGELCPRNVVARRGGRGMTVTEAPACDSCYGPLLVEGDKWVCSRDANHNIRPLVSPSGIAIVTRERRCSICGGRVVSGMVGGLRQPWWCLVNQSHDID